MISVQSYECYCTLHSGRFFRDTLYSPWRKSKGKLCFLSPWRRVRMHQNTPFWNKKKPSGGARRLQRLKLWTPHSEILRTPMIKTAPTMQQNTLSVDNKIHLFLGRDCTLPGLTVVEEDTSPVVHTPPGDPRTSLPADSKLLSSLHRFLGIYRAILSQSITDLGLRNVNLCILSWDTCSQCHIHVTWC